MRLKDYDYSQVGYYFVTICTYGRQYLLWNNIVGATCGRPKLSAIGDIVDNEINKIHRIYCNIKIEKYVIMSNHIHMILIIDNNHESGRPEVAPTISRIIQQFKGSVSKQVGFSIWQKSYHDHIIRNKEEYREIWEYIDTNPLKWEIDKYYI